MKLMEIKAKDNTAYPGMIFIFNADSINVTEDEVDYDELEMLNNDKPFTPKGVTFAGIKINKYDAFEQTINDYLRECNNNTEFIYICPEIKNIKDHNDDLKLYQLRFDTITEFTLVAKSENFSYYVANCGEYCFILDSDKEIITDMEPFYLSGLCESIENNELTFINKDMLDLDEFIKEYDLTVKEKKDE